MANTKYDPYEDIKKWTYNKGLYDDAVKRGDKAAQKTATDNGMASYFNLQNNGYGDLAKSLGDTDYAGAKKIENDYVKNNKVTLKPYLYGSKLKTEYGLSDNEIDKLINIDEASGIVELGPTSFGSPYATIDGEPYWDKDSLDISIDEFINMSGMTPVTPITIPESTSESVGANDEINIPYTSPTDNSQILFNKQLGDSKKLDIKYDELYDYAMHENPFETPEGKAIMADYDLKALQGRDNAVSSGAASNGGNIDSYAAANGLRQQAALTAQGQQVAIAAQTERINNVRGILGDIYNTNMGEDAGMMNTIKLQQSEEQRKHDNNYDIASVTGYMPSGWLRATNPYFGEDGTLKNPNTDYSLEIERLKDEQANETDPIKKANIATQISYLLDARNYKTSPDNYGGKWVKEAEKDLGIGYAPAHTLASRQTEYNYDLGLGTNATNDKQVEYGHEENMASIAIDRDSVNYTILSHKIAKGIPISDEDAKLLGYNSADEFTKDYKNNHADDEQSQKRIELYNNAVSGMPITQADIDAAGYSDMTVDQYYAQINVNRSLLNPEEKRNAAISQITSLAQTRAPIPEALFKEAGYPEGMNSEAYYAELDSNKPSDAKTAEQATALSVVYTSVANNAPIPQWALDAAGYEGMTSDMFYEIHNAIMKDANKDGTSQTALQNIYTAVATGMPIDQDMLNAAGFYEYTPDAFTAKYLSNLGGIYEVEKKNPELTASSSKSASSGGSGKGTASTKNKDKLSKTDKQKIMNHIDDEGGAGLKTLLDTYNWDEYDIQDVYDFISGNYGTDDEVMAVVDVYLGVPFTDTYMRRINNEYGDGTLKKVSGGYDITSNSGKQDVITFIANDSTITTDEKIAILYAYGISEQDLQKWQENNKPTLGEAFGGFIKGIVSGAAKKTFKE